LALPDLPPIYAAKGAAENELLARRGVTGVDVGFKEVNGKPTDKIAIRVFVEQKADPPAADAIPAEIDGHPTDVIERTFTRIARDTARLDPLVGGASIGALRPTATPGGNFTTAGTLGLVVTDGATGAPMLLSNFHVLCHVDNLQQPGDEILQPGVGDGGQSPQDTAGHLQRFVLNELVDCAICDVANRGTTGAIEDVGITFGKRALDHTDVLNQTPVRKRGATTGVTFGTIESIDLSYTAKPGDYGALGDPTFRNQIHIRVDSNQSVLFADFGDSGSVLITNENQVVGLITTKDSTGGGASANHILNVMDALKIEMPTPDLPTVTSVNPSKGVETGGTPVTITGSGLGDVTAVGFGGSASPNFNITSGTEITADAPAGAGVAHVTVTSPEGASIDNDFATFEFVPPVEVQAIIPASGPEAGATAVLVSGQGFTDAGAVTFAGVDSVFNVVTDEQISATTPPGTGDADVIVTGPAGASPAVVFSYLPVPQVTSVTPATAPLNVLTNVEIEGAGFTAAHAVSFGNNQAAIFNVDNDGLIKATVPPGAQGVVDVTVTTPGGTSATGSDDEYSYGPPLPEVTSIDPAHGPAAGGTPVRVTGSGFTGAVNVEFQSGNPVGFTFVSDTEIDVTSLAGNAGDTVDVLVTTAVGTSDPTRLDEFTFDP
jgi:IPT/TIG domain